MAEQYIDKENSGKHNSGKQKDDKQNAGKHNIGERNAGEQNLTKQDLICINCPMGCALTVMLDGEEVVSVSGNTCRRGDIYARKEVTNPTRIVTTTVKVRGGTERMVSVKTREDVPKGKILDCVKALRDVTVEAPVAIGDVVLENVADTGVDIVATKNIGIQFINTL